MLFPRHALLLLWFCSFLVMAASVPQETSEKHKRASDDPFLWLTPEAARDDQYREIYPLRVSHNQGNSQYLALCRGSAEPDALTGFTPVPVNDQGGVPESGYEALIKDQLCYFSDGSSTEVHSVFTIIAGRQSTLTTPSSNLKFVFVGIAPTLFNETGFNETGFNETGFNETGFNETGGFPNTYLCNIPHSTGNNGSPIFLEGIFQLDGTNTSTCYIPDIKLNMDPVLGFSANMTTSNLYNVISPVACASGNTRQTTSVACHRGTFYDPVKCQCFRSSSSTLEAITTISILTSLLVMVNNLL